MRILNTPLILQSDGAQAIIHNRALEETKTRSKKRERSKHGPRERGIIYHLHATGVTPLIDKKKILHKCNVTSVSDGFSSIFRFTMTYSSQLVLIDIFIFRNVSCVRSRLNSSNFKTLPPFFFFFRQAGPYKFIFHE